MNLLHKTLWVGALWLCFLAMPHGLWAQTPCDDGTQQIITLLKEQNSHLTGELGRIQREIAALRAALDKPGFKDILAGVGYIAGLFGVAAFVASRRKE